MNYNYFLSIKQVKRLIDQSGNDGVEVEVVGTVIGFDSMNYAHLSDATGTIYIRATHRLLTIGGVVKVKGIGFVFRGNHRYPEYTRQIKADGIEIEHYYGFVSSPKLPYVLSKCDIKVNEYTDYKNIAFHGNVVQITGIIQKGENKFSFYLVDDEGNKLVGIHHYSSNFRNQTTNASRNIFIRLDGKKVTITGVIYRFYTKENIWTIQCIGLTDEIYVIKENVNIIGKVNILSINDTHGVFYTDFDKPGLEKVQSVIKLLENEKGPYIKIANGDIFKGSYISNTYFGLPMVESLNIMNFDILNIGNHEFDWGIDLIGNYSDKADFCFLAANIFKTNGEKLSWTKDFITIENNGYKVGIIGTIGEGLETSIITERVAGFNFKDPVRIVETLALKLRTENKCDAVIVATHAYSPLANSRMAALTGESRIDGIICAHSHQQIANYEPRNDGYLVPIMQSNAYNQSIGEMIIGFDDQNNVICGAIKHYYPSLYADDEHVLMLINKYQEDINKANRVIGYTVEHLYVSRLGEEMVAAMKEKYQTDISFFNTGGVRAEIRTGNIAIKHIFDVFPFDNKIVLTTILGSDLLLLYRNRGGHLFFNSEFVLEEIDANLEYNISTIDYVFTSPHHIIEFSNSEGVFTNDLMRDVFIEYIEKFNVKK